MGFQIPNPPAGGSTWEDGRSWLYTANIAGIGSNAFAVQLGNWTGLATIAGVVPTPVNSLLNAVTVIPRDVRRGNAGAAADVGWNGTSSAANKNSILFPGAANDMGFKMSIIGGVDVNVSAQGTTDIFMGVSNTAAAFPTPGNTFTTPAMQWMGLYSDSANGANMLFGFKNANGAVTPLVTSVLPISWAIYQGFRLEIECNPRSSPAQTKWKLQYLTGRNSWTTLTQGVTALFTPGRVPLIPSWRCRKNAVAEVLDLWIANVVIRSYYMGNFSL